jgi:hypothetical protein
VWVSFRQGRYPPSDAPRLRTWRGFFRIHVIRRNQHANVGATSTVCLLAVKQLQAAGDSLRVNQCWMALFLRFPSADLKIGAIARIVVGCYRIPHN